MAVIFPVATSAAQAVADPFGHAARSSEAQSIAAAALAKALPPGMDEPARARFAREVRCVHVDAFAPGRWRSREAVVDRWGNAIDAFWAEPLPLLDGTWRLGIRYWQTKAPLLSQLTDEEREELQQRAERPMQPKRPRTQQGMDFGLFAQFAGISPDALKPGSFEVPDPLRPGRTLPDE